MQYLDTASVVLGALAGMADTPAAPLPKGSYFTEARIREILRISALRCTKKFILTGCSKPARSEFVGSRVTRARRLRTYPLGLVEGVHLSQGPHTPYVGHGHARERQLLEHPAHLFLGVGLEDEHHRLLPD